MDINTFEKGSVLMVSGDSVTDCGRARPIGSYIFGLGNGYVNRMHEIITSYYPEKEIKVVNMGISGETSRQVVARWDADIAAVKPDYAALMIGVNDVWRRHDAYMDKEIGVHADEYEANLRGIIERSRSLKGLMLITPIFFELNKSDPFMREIDECSGICRRLAKEYGVDFCDVQPEIDRIISAQYTSTFSPDRVHPGPVAHYTLAHEILRQMNFKF